MPITPDEAAARRLQSLPPEVLEVFDDLIARNWDGHSATFTQSDAIQALKTKGFAHSQIFSGHMLDVEEVYRANGWRVEYDKPGFNESYPATFTFARKKR